MRIIMLVSFLTVQVANAGVTQFGDPPATITVNAGSTFTTTAYSDVTDNTTEPFKQAVMTIDCSTSLAQPSVSTTLTGCYGTIAKTATGYTITFTAGSDAILTGAMFKLTWVAPSAAGSYQFKVSSLTMTNSTGKSVNVATPVDAPDTLVVKSSPWKWILRILGA